MLTTDGYRNSLDYKNTSPTKINSQLKSKPVITIQNEGKNESDYSDDSDISPLSNHNNVSRPEAPKSNTRINDMEGDIYYDDESVDTPNSVSGVHAASVDGYNPNEYLNLNVSKEVKDLFQYINQYKPQDIQLDTKLKCFVPDYLPSIGQIDNFIKVPRPDEKPDGLGLTHLDEPATIQTDRTVLELQLRAISKKKTNDPIMISSIENADKNPERIQQWIDSVEELHKTKPPVQVHYTKGMPDTESLMEQWNPEFEEALNDIDFPDSDIDLSLSEYSRLICSILDIPVYDKNPKNNSVVESLHCLFTLYNTYSEIPNFADKKPHTLKE